MRQLLSTALVACIVGALAGASFGAVAQAPAEPPVTTTALNADTVDGLSAVKATSKKTKRKNKLVATDAKGFLPSNIVKAKWGLIAGKPAFLADGQVGWNEVAGIPAPSRMARLAGARWPASRLASPTAWTTSGASATPAT